MADALDALLEAWADAPSPALATCITTASALARTEPAGLRGSRKPAIEAWAKAARSPHATEIPALLDALADVRWRDALARLFLMRKWRPDPRVDEALVRLLETLPYRSTSKPFYTELVAQVGRIRDPALFERIVAAMNAIGTTMSATLGEWLGRRVAALVAELQPLVAKPVAKPDLREVEQALADARKSAAPRVELAELLRAVYEDPDDTARRLVYADALLERGDVRGELIVLECQPSLSADRQRRARALLAEHGKRWLGELAPIVKEFRFERGFLAECTIASHKGSRIKRVVGHPAWSTVHTLADSAQIALDPVMRSLRTLEFRPNRARQREGLVDAWRELLAGAPRPIERLHLTDLDMYGDRDEQLALLARCDALPKLRQLYVGGIANFYCGDLLRSDIAGRIETLGFNFERADDIALDVIRALSDARVPSVVLGALSNARVPRVVIRHEELTLRIERGDTAYERVWFELHGRDVAQVVNLLGVLPPSIRELRVSTPPDLDRGALVALSVAARTLRALEVREIGPR